MKPPHAALRRPLWLLGVGILLLVWAAGCQKPSPEPASSPQIAAPDSTPAAGQLQQLLPTATPTPTPLAGQLVLWHSWTEGDADALSAILAEYQRLQPGIQIETLYVAYPELAQAYLEAVAGGGGPDLLLAPNWWLPDLAAAKAILPLDGLVTAEEEKIYWPAALENFRLQGELYGLPTSYEVVSVFVNRTLADPASIPTTLDGWLAQAQQGPTLGIGLYNNLYHLVWGISAYGARLFDEAGTSVLDQAGDAAGYLRWLRALSQTPGSYVDPDYGMLKDRFRKGEFAYFVDGPWAIGELSEVLDLAVVPLPAGPAGASEPWLSADGVLLHPALSASQQPLALAFARFLTTAESGRALASLAGRLPASRNTPLADYPLLQGFARQAAEAQPLPLLPEMAPLWGYGGDLFVKVVDGDADPAATVVETAALINDATGQ